MSLPSRFLWPHVWLPGVLVASALVAVAVWDLDRRIADALFFDRPAEVWIGANTWWAVDLIHTGGGAIIRLIGIASLGALVASFWVLRLRPLRRQLTFVVLALLLCPTFVAGLKQVTNVDCPRALENFGGTRPYVALLGDRPDDLPRGYCYPGSHSSSGFALMAFYFVLADTRPRLARRLLAAAIAVGALFSFGQQARGAHFLSHDLASAAMDWFLLLALWRLLLKSPSPAPTRLIVSDPRVQLG